MKRILQAIVFAFIWVLLAPVGFGQTDRTGSKDYPGISRMPGYHIEEYRESQFDSFTFAVMENGKERQQPIEGHLYSYRYNRGKGTAALSDLQVIRNFQNAARSAGAQVLRDAGTTDRETTFRFVQNDHEVWVAVATRAHGDVYHMIVVEKQVMQQEIAMDAAAMAHDLGDAGRVTIYGIHFDSGKSEVKPDSQAALGEIAKLLKQDPALRVYIVGHTDMVADLAINLKLSQARAQAVMTALVSQFGIADTRLLAFGNGPYAPMASNKTEAGRAKNRRVELVEIATR